MHRTETTSHGDADEYRRRSYRNWQSAAAGWEREREALQSALGPLTDWMLDRLAAEPGQTLLELGAGTGETGLLAARLVGPAGHVILTDRSTAMLEAAGRRAAELELANVELRVLDMEAIDLPDAAVDGVLCRLALMLLPDTAVALAGIRRVLRPGGRLVATVWDAVERNPWAPALWEVIEGLTPLPPARPGGPGMFSLGDEGRLETLLSGAGFGEIAVEPIAVEWRYPDFESYWRTQSSLNGSLSQLLPTLPQEERDRLAGAVRGALERFRTADGYRAPGSALGIAAR
ncbi:MAG TPA: class I SAM-dependent methyltransferase [Gaiellales bacterium]|nr:class I SAM-dependent methyltransferase [Gaiellales bacterium]